jgi:hypothetical protein
MDPLQERRVQGGMTRKLQAQRNLRIFPLPVN